MLFEFGYIDIPQLLLYGFWLAFFGLIWYLRREDKRQGYPLEAEGTPSYDYIAVPEPRIRAKHPTLEPTPEGPTGSKEA